MQDQGGIAYLVVDRRFQFSIGDARALRGSLNATVTTLLVSILHWRCVGVELPAEFGGFVKSFNSPLEMCSTRPRWICWATAGGFNSPLEMQTTTACLSSYTEATSFNSPLEMHRGVSYTHGPAGPEWFQFSIGDAWIAAFLIIIAAIWWIVSILHWRCPPGGGGRKPATRRRGSFNSPLEMRRVCAGCKGYSQ